MDRSEIHRHSFHRERPAYKNCCKKIYSSQNTGGDGIFQLTKVF